MGVMLMDYDNTQPDITYPCDVNRQRGYLTRLWARGVAAGRKEQDANQGLASENARNEPVAPAMANPEDIRTVYPDPRLMTDDERGEGDSTNARLHRLMNPRKYALAKHFVNDKDVKP